MPTTVNGKTYMGDFEEWETPGVIQSWPGLERLLKEANEKAARREAAHWHGKAVGDLTEQEYQQWQTDLREMQGVEG